MVKAGIVEGTKEYDDLQKQIRDAEEANQKQEQQQFEDQTKRDQTIFDYANSNPEGFKEKYLTDPDYEAAVDATLNRYKERGKPVVNQDTGEITYSSPMGVTPSGKISPFPDVTFVDPLTGLVETMSAKDVPFNLGPDSPISDRLRPFLEWQYSLTPQQQFDMQMGGAPPSLPPNIASSLMGPPPLKSDIYSTGPSGEQIPYYPYLPEGDTSTFVPMMPGSEAVPNFNYLKQANVLECNLMSVMNGIGNNYGKSREYKRKHRPLLLLLRDIIFREHRKWKHVPQITLVKLELQNLL